MRVFDALIVGSGFAGSLLARILATRGLRVGLIDQTTHPRFAIGESSTPLADAILHQIAARYQLDDLCDLATYGRWQQSYPDIACGLKRGFSYYVHREGRPFSEDNHHSHSLLVAASASDDVGDTHWYRPEVDRHFFDLAAESGVTTFVPARPRMVVIGQRGAHHRLELDTGVSLTTAWLIDSTGRAGGIARLLKSKDEIQELRTSTQTTFAHYRNVASWAASHGADDDPFQADASAQHHLCDEGWLWMLRFENGITSVGYTSPSSCPRRSLDHVIDRHPSLSRMFAQATLVAPRTGPVVVPRLQFKRAASPADRVVLLPTTAVTVDPLHSTGIAHALSGVSRIAEHLVGESDASDADWRRRYASRIDQEARLIDDLVSSAYAGLHDFRRFTVAAMLYFAAAIRSEESIQQGRSPDPILCTDEPELMSAIRRGCDLIRGESATDDVWESVAELIAPFNNAGLLDFGAANRYAYTATKR
ncbi:MAG: tryptophan 7-halogenase [Planctomycetota bacterium]